MGSKLESNPTIRGQTQAIPKQFRNYFKRIRTIQKNSFISNSLSDQNLMTSLEIKPFDKNPYKPPNYQDVTWLEYITNHLHEYHYAWGNELLEFINRQTFVKENKYNSLFFYNEYLLNTIPDVLNDEIDLDNDENIIAIDKVDEHEMAGNTNIDELDISDNLGGSYLEINLDDLLPNDPTIQYQQQRKHLKKYVKIFKEHVDRNFEHPIMIIICGFIRIFCRYIKDKMKSIQDNLNKSEIDVDNYNAQLKNFEKEVTSSLQNFITHMHCSLKLFYSTVIDLKTFSQEKDDLMNMLITVFFKTGKLYETIYNLYNLAYTKEIQDFQDKLIKLRNVKPKSLGIDVKFCLDEDTLELQQQILKQKNEEEKKK
jgi:hypothetical protein